MDNGQVIHLVSTVLKKATIYLEESGIDSPQLDSRLLLAHVLDVLPQRLSLHQEIIVREEQRISFSTLIGRRVMREPVSRILSRRGFWTMELRLNADTFDPRPESETLVESVLEQVENKELPYKILDLGTGSGCLLLALLMELPYASGIGVDITENVLTIARENAAAMGLSKRTIFQLGDWGKGLADKFDIIVANPPYIAESDLTFLEPEVRFDPDSTILGGQDGLAAYRVLVPCLPRLLQRTGLAALEIGHNQLLPVKSIAEAVRLELVKVAQDFSGKARCLILQGRRQTECWGGVL